MGAWRNSSASDSRSEGWEFESLCPQFDFCGWPAAILLQDGALAALCAWQACELSSRATRTPEAVMCSAATRAHSAMSNFLQSITRGHGATAARLTPDQKVGSLNLSALNLTSVSLYVTSLELRRLSISSPCAATQQKAWPTCRPDRLFLQLACRGHAAPVARNLAAGP